LRLPQPGGPGSRIYIPQEQGGPVIPPGTGFPFCRLLRLAWTTVEVRRPVFYLKQFNSVFLSVPHRKHITPPLRAQNVNVTMAYYYNYHKSGHYTSFSLYLKHDVSENGFWPRSQTEISSISCA
jgi:hypothetical protein